VFLQSQNWLERRPFGERGKGEAEAVRGEEPRRRRAA